MTWALVAVLLGLALGVVVGAQAPRPFGPPSDFRPCFVHGVPQLVSGLCRGGDGGRNDWR